MPDLSTTYLGLKLRNPIVVSSSNLTSTVEKVAACEEAGAGAVVLKSLFEEQIEADTSKMMDGMDATAHTDAYDYFRRSGNYHYMDDYFGLVEAAKERVDIPVIASLNCISAGAWLDYAQRFERVGADALELNVFVLPADISQSGEDVEKIYLDICRKIRKKVKIPVALKIGSHFSGLANFIKQMSDSGIGGLVLFNRFYRPDVDTKGMRIVPARALSAPEEMADSLRWIALLSGEINCDFAAATGVHDGNSVVKQLLVGAKTVQVCSTLMTKGLGQIAVMTGELEAWMSANEFQSIDDFRGKLCQEASDHPEIYERSQYVKALVGIS